MYFDNKENFNRIMELLPAGVFICDNEDNVIETNQRCRDLFNDDPSGVLIDRRLSLLFSSIDDDKSMQKMRVGDSLICRKVKDFEHFYELVFCGFADDRRVYSVTRINKRINSFFKGEYIHSILENLPFGAAVSSISGSIQYSNNEFKSLSASDDGRCDLFYYFDALDKERKRGILDRVAAGEVWSGTVLCRDKDGHSKKLKCTYIPTRSEFFLKKNDLFKKTDTFIEVRESLSRTEKSRFREDQAEKLEILGKLSTGITHDLKNLISPVLGYAELMLDDFDETSVYHNDLVEIKTAAENSIDLIKRISNFSKKQPLQLRTVDLNLVIDNIKKMLVNPLKEDVSLVIRKSDRPALIDIDRVQFTQVLLNLVMNSDEAIDKSGKIIIDISHVSSLPENIITLEGVNRNDWVKISVSDTGKGMSDSIISKIFDPFYTQGKLNGTGLGLANVYKILKNHNAHIDVKSSEGMGSCFSIYFKSTARKRAPWKKMPEGQQLDNKKYDNTILVVDDNEKIVTLVKRILENSGFKTISADNGKTGFTEFLKHRKNISLVITDIMMPEMDGLELTEKICEIERSAKIVFMSAFSEKILNDKGYSELKKMFPVLKKPFHRDDLLNIIKKSIDSSEIESTV